MGYILQKRTVNNDAQKSFERVQMVENWVDTLVKSYMKISCRKPHATLSSFPNLWIRSLSKPINGLQQQKGYL